MNKTLIRTVTAGLIGAAAVGLCGVAHADTFGDPEGMAGWWVQQSYDDCMIMSAADVIGQITGDEPTEDDIVDYASNAPSVTYPGTVILRLSDDCSDPTVGATLADLPSLFDHYGVAAKYVGSGSLEDLEQVLGNNGAVVVGVNAETIWNTDGDRTQPNHAVVVTGVDTDAGIVHLNDSGTDGGSDEQVSIDTFMAAWQTSGNEMVETT